MRTARAWRWSALAAGLLFAFPGAARAEGESDGGLREKIRQQMAKIRELMEKNEAALLELSTGGNARPRDVDVTVPPPQGQGGAGGAQGGPSGAGSGAEGAGSRSEATVRALDELLGGSGAQGSGDGVIPDELKQLVEMVPLCDSCSGQLGASQPKPQGSQNGQPQGSEQLRDGRRPDGMEPGQEQDGQRPGDPAREGDADRQPRPGETGDRNPDLEDPPTPDSQGGWSARLPAELREAAANGRLDRVPARYRKLVERYYRWLQQQKAAGSR